MDYKQYKYSVYEMGMETLRYLGAVTLFSYFFYRSFIPFILGALFIYPYLLLRKKYYLYCRKQKLMDEFREALKSISAAMKAGYSMENAFLEGIKDVSMFYGQDSLMVQELIKIRKGLELNLTIEELIEDFGNRSGIDEIKVFSTIIDTAKRNGGSINSVFENTAIRIAEKQELKKEIDILIAEKKYELRIMEAIPFFILFYIEFTNRGYFSPLYGNIKGILFMTGCILVYFFSAALASRIMRIGI